MDEAREAAKRVPVDDLDAIRRHIETSTWHNKPLCYALVDEIEQLRDPACLPVEPTLEAWERLGRVEAIHKWSYRGEMVDSVHEGREIKVQRTVTEKTDVIAYWRVVAPATNNQGETT